MHEVDTTVHLEGLCTQDDSGLVAVGMRSLTLRWRLASRRAGVRQAAFEVQRAATPDFADPISSGRTDSPLVFGAAWPGAPLASREVAWCRVRAWTDGGVTGWSEPLRVEGSLFGPDDWAARPISPPSNAGRADPVPPPLLRKGFVVRPGLVRARLYVTALGVHETRINGRPVSADLFEPGWTDYPRRLLFAAYDVAGLLDEGENAIGAMLGDGWWRGNLTWLPKRGVYGEMTAYLAQLELAYADDSTEVVATDGTWRAGQGAVRMADFYNGCTMEPALEPDGWTRAGFDDGGWEAVTEGPLPEGLEQRTMPPVAVVETIPVVPAEGPGGTVRFDCGQNLTGWLRLAVEAEGPARLTVRHAEVLEPDGALHLSSLRSAEATDRYAIEAGRNVLEPAFTFHGFRHAEVAVEGAARIVSCEARVVSTALPRTGRFRCSHEGLNRLYENILWSQRGNFLAIPTDCPQRDERLGWTGDIQVFAPTACANFDSRAFLSSWLVDLEGEQRADGNVPSTVPNVIHGHEHEYGGVGWADAATLVPWALYEAYGDAEVLVRQYASMKAWVDYGTSRLGPDRTWTGDVHLGDWLDPAAPVGYPGEATTDRDFVASAYLAHSARVLSQAAGVLARDDDRDTYARLGDAVAAATWRRWHAVAPLTQTGCALAICFGIAPLDEREAVGAALAALVAAGDGRIGTGFLGTPLVLPALTLTGQDEAAMRLLLNEEAPGWLYQVRQGATTVWERWDAIRPDGSIHPGDIVVEDSPGMMSFNHYAYGSVGAWLYRTLAGIAPAEPGYAVIDFAPRPGPGVDWAEAGIDTPFGPAAIAWRREGERLEVTCTAPPGAQGRFHCPPGRRTADGGETAFGSGERRFLLVVS